MTFSLLIKSGVKLELSKTIQKQRCPMRAPWSSHCLLNSGTSRSIQWQVPWKKPSCALLSHIFLVELDTYFDQNFSTIYRELTKTKRLSIQPSHRSNETFSKHHGFFVDFGTCSNFWKTRWKGGRIILLPLCSPLVNFLCVSHTLSPGFCWMKTSVDLLHSCL